MRHSAFSKSGFDSNFLGNVVYESVHNICVIGRKKLFAVSHHPDCGPVFGAGADLFLCDECDRQPDSYSNLPHSYDGPVRITSIHSLINSLIN